MGRSDCNGRAGRRRRKDAGGHCHVDQAQPALERDKARQDLVVILS